MYVGFRKIKLSYKIRGGVMFNIFSSEIVEQGIIPTKYTADGKNVSPPLNWGDAPIGTKSFAFTIIDPDLPLEEAWFPFPIKVGDLPGDLFIHWIIYDIPASVTHFHEGISPGGNLPAGAKELKNSGAAMGMPAGYMGMAPPQGHKAHKYIFTLYALSAECLGLSSEASYIDFVNAIKGKVLATASLSAYFGH